MSYYTPTNIKEILRIAKEEQKTAEILIGDMTLEQMDEAKNQLFDAMCQERGYDWSLAFTKDTIRLMARPCREQEAFTITIIFKLKQEEPCTPTNK